MVPHKNMNKVFVPVGSTLKKFLNILLLIFNHYLYCHHTTFFLFSMMYFLIDSTPSSHSLNFFNITPILSLLSTFGFTHVIVTFEEIWFIWILTKSKEAAFITMNYTCSAGIEQIPLKSEKDKTLLFLGRLNAVSRKAINLIFWSRAVLFDFKSS